jgi:septal ring factor EnvC (AmiA/AmiB activator)
MTPMKMATSRSRCRSSSLLLAILLITATPPLLAANDRSVKEAQLKQLRERIGELRSELGQVRNHYDALRAELRDTEQRIGKVTRNLAELDEQLAAQKQKLSQLKQRQGTLEQGIVSQRTYLSGQIRASYMMGRQEYFKILLNQEDPATLGRVTAYYDYLNRARSERIGEIQHTLRELEAIKGQLVNETETLRQLRKQRAADKRDLEEGKQQREVVVGKLKREISSKDRQLEGLLIDEQELQNLLQALTEALEDIPAESGDHKPFAKLKGNLAWPSKGPLIVKYNSMRKTGQLRWQGVMIKNQEGAPVRAISHGRIAFADWLRGYGLLLIIDHGDGYMSLYGHNQSLFKETGDWVEAGEQVATVGNSGGFDKVALYFEIRKNGQPVNPGRWCKR